MKKHLKPLLSLIAGTFYSVCILGQAAVSFDNAAPPAVIPPSPAAAALFNNVNTPVNYYVGAQQTSIPLYTIKLGSLQLPISIGYRATGIRVEEDAGWTGLEWDLVAGGAIGRSIIGKPDENTLNDVGGAGFRASAVYFGMPDPTPDGLSTSNWLGNLSTCDLYNLALGKNFELTPDSYFMNFCGHSARLFFDKNATPYFSPYKSWKLTGNEAAGFTVVTEDGTIYLFNLPEYSTNTSETFPTDDHSTPISGNTSWYLTKVISANGTDTINLAYKSVNYTPLSYNPTESYSIPLSNQPAPYCGGIAQTNSTQTVYTHNIAGYVLQSIATREQRLDFLSNANRADITDSTQGLPYKLDSLKLYHTAPGMADQLIKKFVFQYDYYNASSPNAISKRLRLLSISEIGSAGEAGQTYSFTYNSNSLPDRNSKAQDLWGYYNGADQNTNIIPTYTDANGVTTVLANRSVNEGLAGQGLLQQIKYPTGGTTSFEYEANRAGVADSVAIVKEVYAVTTASGNTDQTPDTLTFSVPYDQPVSVIGIINEGDQLVGEGYVSLYQVGVYQPIWTDQAIGYTTFQVQLHAGVTYQLIATKTSTNVYARINLSYYYHVANPVIGNPTGGARISRIVESDGLTSIVKRFQYLLNDSVSSGNIMGSGVYSSNEYYPQICDDAKVGDWSYYTQHSVSTVDIGRIQGGYVGYSKVTVLYGDNGENGSEDLYYNFVPDDGGSRYPYAPVASNDDLRGLLLQRVVYRNDHSIVQRTTNYYNLNNQSGNPNFRRVFGTKAGIIRRSNTFDANACPAGTGWSLNSTNYSIYQLWPTLASTVEQTFGSAVPNIFSTTSWFTYDTTNLQVVKKYTISSKGDTVNLVYKYPKDLAGTRAYDSMLSRNMTDAVVETDKFDNNGVVGKKVTNYGLVPGAGMSLIEPQSIQLQNGNNILETRLLFNKYDNRGNLVSENKANDAEHIYLWGYQGIYPVAEIVNADSTSVVYSSFEDGTTGNWNASGGTFVLGAGITGNYYYNLPTGGSISKSGLNGTRKYVLTYWSTSGPLTANGTAGTPGDTRNGWTYYQHTLPAGTTSVTITGAGISIDELRMYPADALMTTYTYNPLVGQSSICSPNNQVTYYEYDGLQRLAIIRDQDGNIVKTLQYHYQGQ